MLIIIIKFIYSRYLYTPFKEDNLTLQYKLNITLATVYIHNSTSPEQALLNLKKLCQREGILLSLKLFHAHHIPNAEKRKVKDNLRKRKVKSRMRLLKRNSASNTD